jgi:hypothetical protein
MKPESLRSEFVLTGGATLFSIYLFVISVERRSRPSCFFHGRLIDGCPVHAFSIPDQLSSSGAAVVAVAFLIGIAFILGILVVQITFFFPTEGMIYVRRKKLFRELCNFDADLRKGSYEPCGESNSALLASAFNRNPGRPMKFEFLRAFTRFYIGKLSGRPSQPSAGESIALSIGRQIAHETIIREYEYRRSNRQVFIGVLPAFIIAVTAAVINPWSSRQEVQDIISAAAITIGIIVVLIIFASANYQERVAQAQLLDIAFVALWAKCKDSSQATVREAGRTRLWVGRNSAKRPWLP